jgi:hypothetical protein
MVRYRLLLRGSVLVGLLAASAWAQTLSIPIDPANTTLEMGRRRPDGTQFVLSVRISGSPPIRYVASREDMVRRQAEQFSELMKLNDAETKRGELLSSIAQQKQAKVDQLERSKADLMEQLSNAQAASTRARGRVKASDTDTEKASSTSAAEVPSGGAGTLISLRSESASATTTGTPTSTSQVPSNPPAQPKADAESAIDQLPAQPDLLPIAIPDDATLKIAPNKIRPDGSQLVLELALGGIHLNYIANREDVVGTQVEQYRLQSALRNSLGARNVALESQNAQLDAKADLLEADVTDLRRGLSLAKQNMAQLAEILKAQRRPWWQALVEALPTVAGIAALATK